MPAVAPPMRMICSWALVVWFGLQWLGMAWEGFFFPCLVISVFVCSSVCVSIYKLDSPADFLTNFH